MSKLIECRACPEIFHQKNSLHVYCTEECRNRYKTGVILFGRGKIKKCFQDTAYTVKAALKEAEEQGYETVTVRFND